MKHAYETKTNIVETELLFECQNGVEVCILSELNAREHNEHNTYMCVFERVCA